MACRHIRLYGARDPVMAVELLQMLAEVGRCATTEERRAAVWHQAEMVLAAAKREIVEPHDREAVRRAAAAVTSASSDGQGERDA